MNKLSSEQPMTPTDIATQHTSQPVTLFDLLSGICRGVALCLWIVSGLVLELLLFPWLRWGPIKRGLIQHWHQGVLILLRIKVIQHGQSASQQSIVCANHISWLDIVVIGATLPACYISKREVKSWPLIGRLATLAGTIYLDRRGNNLGEVQRAMHACLRKKNTLVFFPEGTTGTGDKVHPFKAALFRVAVAEGLPIQPMLISYGSSQAEQRRVAYVDNDHFVKHLWLQLISPPVTAEIRVLPLIQVPTLRGLNISGTGNSAELYTLKALARDLAEDTRNLIVSAHAATRSTTTHTD